MAGMNGSGFAVPIAVTGPELVTLFGREIERKLAEMTRTTPETLRVSFAFLVWGEDGKIAWGCNRDKQGLMVACSALLQQMVDEHQKPQNVIVSP